MRLQDDYVKTAKKFATKRVVGFWWRKAKGLGNQISGLSVGKSVTATSKPEPSTNDTTYTGAV
jgi:hypothetical protein